MKYVFVNEMTHELHFVYQPIYSSAISSDLAPFLYDVAYSVTLALNEDYKCVNNFIAYLKGLQAVSVINIEKYLLDVYPQIYKQVKRQNTDKVNISVRLKTERIFTTIWIKKKACSRL